ncbi:hypothetical protein [Desulfopila sp. IMCC35008]|uniref:hypothetical protein n=1 Tax=Desulfopila sp. IMCC35008 TaxID=2653858 RepID=UPI0013D36607|nr:hypothetical protein [Desulfopila sp. IMCC35008]
MNHFTDGWNAISTRRKSVLIAEFLKVNEEDLGYEQWLDFLWQRLCADTTVHPNVCIRPDNIHFGTSSLRKSSYHPLEE